MFDLMFFIGRFQPFHVGHAFVIEEALQRARHLLLLIGSVNHAYALNNPWNYEERKALIEKNLRPECLERIRIDSLCDVLYHDEVWVRQVREKLEACAADLQAKRIALIGHEKDKSSYYLKIFPNCDYVSLPDYQRVSATDIREDYFRQHLAENDPRITATTFEFLKEFRKNDRYARFCEEQRSLDAYRESWSTAPFPPVFVTVDALLHHRGKILLVERGRAPGKGLLALPGGFLEQEETLFQACLRELSEETGLHLPQTQQYLRRSRAYDAPRRSLRGRTITHVFYFDISELDKVPEVHAADDAQKALWLPLADLKPNCIFEDHFHIIRDLLKLV